MRSLVLSGPFGFPIATEVPQQQRLSGSQYGGLLSRVPDDGSHVPLTLLLWGLVLGPTIWRAHAVNWRASGGLQSGLGEYNLDLPRWDMHVLSHALEQIYRTLKLIPSWCQM